MTHALGQSPMDLQCNTPTRSSNRLYTITLKLRELHLDIDYSATIRIGWMSSEMSVFTHWKHVENGRVGWKSSLVQQLSHEIDDIFLVVYQKVGNCEMPVGLRRIPCTRILDSQRKHLFRVPIEEMVRGEGTLCGSVRSKVDEEDTSVLVNNCCNEGSVSSKSSGTGCSIDMSLDLTTEVPTVFFPVITTQEVYHCIIRKHYMISPWKRIFLKVLSTLLRGPTGMCEFVVPNACEVHELNCISYSLFKELQLTLSAAIDTGQSSCFYWNVSKTTNFTLLREVIVLFIRQCNTGENADNSQNSSQMHESSAH